MIAYGTQRALRTLPDAIAEKTARQWENFPDLADKHFRQLKTILGEEEPDYRD